MEKDQQPIKIDIDTEDPETDKIVASIVSDEGDELLAADDTKKAVASVEKVGLSTKIKRFFSGWWNNRLSRYGSILVVLAALTTIAILPGSRYFLLNAAGVRSTASLIILDNSTQLPLKNVLVKIAGQTGQTDKAGNVTLKDLKLGSSSLVIEKQAFASFNRKITVGWGSNPLGEFKLSPKGTQYTLSLVDFLSGKPIAKAEATSGEASALSDDKGMIKLTIDQPTDQLEATIKASGYRDEIIKFKGDIKTTQVIKIVPFKKHAFVSKRTGKYDVYKIDADGKNTKMVLAGTGNERDDIVIAPSPTTNLVAIVSSRDNQRDKDGFLLSTLTIINLDNDVANKVAQSERIQIVDWVGGRLVYVQIAAGASEANPKRYRLMSYDFDRKSSKEIAASNYFNDVLVAQNKLYYSPSSTYIGGSAVGFYRVDGDGSNKQTIKTDEIWNAFRTSYDQITLSVEQQWFDYRIGDSTSKKLDSAPVNLVNRTYADSPDGKRSLWVEERDGKGVLLAYDSASKKDKILLSLDGLSNPIIWLNSSTVIYRIINDQETADYVFSLDGGQPRKISDVTNTGGVDKWYYY